MAMLSDFTPDEHDSPQCGHCGAPLAGRFTPCPSCNARPPASLGARTAPPPPLNIPLADSEALFEPQLPVRKIWKPFTHPLANPYDVVDEPQLAAPVTQKLRRPLVIGASLVVVTSAVYLGFLHTDDEEITPPIAVSGKVTTQNAKPPVPITLAHRSAPVFAAQRPAPVETASGTAPVRSPPGPPPAAPMASRRVTVASSGQKHTPGSPPDKPRVDVSRQLRAARANLQQNNLSATKTRLAAAIAAQPDNRDALNMRTTLTEREQERDALLSLARGCGYIARWGCTWHNAANALLLDSSSKEAQNLVSLATRESELANASPPAPAPASETTSDEHSPPVYHH
ncbi:hypothetical protein B0G76_7840 [Paraburkholderia sp. BL23I1N1]|uniref:zinc ribbon domain-containing protein n=1 Tax=Paraburkholderia sp. BL23I1N1 TaxID=1938802 RepID=UPI000E713237|nr:zinc ribbon domain-containing protein [Paraburkholderia sp. BL23I1N1]RKE26228.1 hypothetical protein B0G76_7840 [Paraburkholderia sp. BL23I1N1]